MLDYTISRSDHGLSVTVFIDGKPMIFGPGHPNVTSARDLLSRQDREDHRHSAQDASLAGELRRIHDIAGDINARLREVSERFSYSDGKFRFDGDIIDKPLTRHMLDRLRTGDDSWTSYAYFMMRLAENPSRESRLALYRWIGDRSLTITEEGLVVGYKGVRSDSTSVHRGKGTVHRLNSDRPGIETETFQNDHLPNDPGSWVEFPRSEVDPDPDSPCSVGLHVGSESFARGFGQRLLTVLVDPAAVVMVPKDEDGQKMRVWQYYVSDIEPAQAMETTTLRAPTAFTLDDPDGEEDGEPICTKCGDADDVSAEWCDYCGDWA